MADPFSLDGKVAFITGAARGIGWAIAEAMGAAGATLVLASRNAQALDDRVATLEERGVTVSGVPFDVTERSAAAAALDDAAARHGRLDILVNNAGIQHREPLVDLGDEAWDRMIETNLTAGFVLARQAARIMVPQGAGRIINTASIMGPSARPTIAAYVAAKGGLAAFTRALAVELGPKGITCNALAPGFIATDMTAALSQNAEFGGYIEARVPLARWGRPEEIAHAAVFLAAPAGSYVNGHVLVVDGGLTVSI